MSNKHDYVNVQDQNLLHLTHQSGDADAKAFPRERQHYSAFKIRHYYTFPLHRIEYRIPEYRATRLTKKLKQDGGQSQENSEYINT